MTRHIDFDAIENFRDFGDYAAGDRRLRKGLLYRSGHHANATEADLAAMAELGIALIVDLRRPNERAREPSRRWPGFGAAVLESDEPEEREDEWADFVRSSDLSVESFRRYMLDYYRHAPLWARHKNVYARYFRALAETDGAVVIHCAAGKDRTGIACALTQHLAGVHKDDILADFLLTNDPARMQRRLPFMRQRIFEITGRTASDEAMLVGMGVAEEYLAQAFRVMTEAHGSLDGYLDQALGLDGSLRERLHARLLA
jgi:protein tyrosine/serine phosphatase